MQRKDSVDVGGQHHASLAGARTIARITAEYITFGVDFNLLQLEFAEAFGQPLGAPALAKRRRRDRNQFLLPLHHPAIVQVEPLERRMNTRQRSQLTDTGKS